MKSSYLLPAIVWVASLTPAIGQIWTGISDSNWNNPSNWSPNTVPNSPSATAIIPSGVPNLPATLSSTIAVGTLVMGSGTSLNLNSQVINIHSNANLSGVTLSNGTIAQIGSSSIALTAATLNSITISKQGSGSIIGFGGNTFTGSTKLESIAGTSGLFSMGISMLSGDTYTGPVTIENASNSVNISVAEFGTHTFSSGITLQNTANGSISFGATFAVITVNGNINGTANTNGTITLRSITQIGGGVNNLGNPANLTLSSCTFSGNVLCSAGNSMSLSSCQLNGSNTLSSPNITQVQNSIIGSMTDTSGITKLHPSSTNNSWFGNNTFRNCTIRNYSNANLRTAASTGDTYTGDCTFQNLGNGLMEVGYFGTNVFQNNLRLQNNSVNGIYVGNAAAPHVVIIQGNLKNLGYTAGALRLQRVMQMATTPNDAFSPATFRATGCIIEGGFACNATQSIQLIENSVFQRENAFFSLRIQQVTNSTFSAMGGKTHFIKTGTSADNWSGNNTFYTLEIDNNSPNALRLANATSSPDFFLGKATFRTLSDPLIPCSTSNCHFRDTISTTGTGVAITFGGNTSGDVIIDGNTAQVIEGNIATAPSIRRMQMNTTGMLTLMVPVTILNSTTFLNGIVKSSAFNIFRYAPAASSPFGSNASHVDGPVEHTRNAGTHAFNFPTGANGWYAPVTIQKSGGPGSFGTFQVQYFRTPYSGGYATDATLDHVSKCEYWDIARPSGSGSVNLTLTWDSVRSCGVTDYPQLRIARWLGALWTSAGGVPGGTNASGSITATGLSSFGSFTLASANSANPLPVELLYFSAKPNGKVVDLTWATHTERNNDYFTVERSRDGLRFEPLLRVPGAGTTTEPKTYAAVDAQPLPGLAYYRLRQTDYDGTFSFSPAVALQMPLNDKTFVVYPNPASEGIFWLDTGVELPDLRWRLLNSMGQTMPVAPQRQGSRLQFHTQGLPAGVYFLEVRHESTVQTIKLVVR